MLDAGLMGLGHIHSAHAGMRVLLPVFWNRLWFCSDTYAEAASYGLMVEDHKRNNVLRVEVSSRDVAELAAELCDPLFSTYVAPKLAAAWAAEA
jgi:hypothetical protein